MERITLIRIRKIAIAIGFGLVISGLPAGSVFAGGGHGRGHDDKHHEERHRDHDRGRVYVAPAPTYYYAPRQTTIMRQSRITIRLRRPIVRRLRRKA